MGEERTAQDFGIVDGVWLPEKQSTWLTLSPKAIVASFSSPRECIPRGEIPPEVTAKYPVSPLAAYVSLVTTCIGVGILLLPYLYTSIGMVQGIIYTILAATMLGITCIVYIRCLEIAAEMDPKRRMYRMEDVAEYCFGRWFFWVAMIGINLTAFSIDLSFHILIGSLFTGIADLGKHSEFYWKLICCAPFLILCAPKDMRVIAKFGFLGVIGVVVIIIAISTASAEAIHDNQVGPDQKAVAFVEGQTVKDSLSGLSTFVFSCGCLPVIPSLYEDMGEKNRKKLPQSVFWTYVTVATLFLAVSVPGYIAFGTEAPSQFLDPDGPVHDGYYGPWLAATIACLVHIFVVYPLLMNGPIRAIEDFLPDKLLWRLAVRVVLVFTGFGLACTPISFFSEIVGLIPASIFGVVGLIFPPLFYWKLLYMQDGSVGAVLATTKRKLIFLLHVAIWIIAVVAIVMGVWGQIDSLIDKLNDNDDA
jgi:hypothetical protein